MNMSNSMNNFSNPNYLWNNPNQFSFSPSPYNNYNIPRRRTEEKISNDLVESYYEDNCSPLIKDLAYRENANARYRDYMEDKGKSILNFNVIG